MKAKHVLVGALYYTKIGDTKVMVKIVQKRAEETPARFLVARVDENGVAGVCLPKARTAASLHVVMPAGGWGGFTEAQDEPLPFRMQSGYCFRYVRNLKAGSGWAEAATEVYTPNGLEVAVGKIKIDGSECVAFRCSDRQYRAQMTQNVLAAS